MNAVLTRMPNITAEIQTHPILVFDSIDSVMSVKKKKPIERAMIPDSLKTYKIVSYSLVKGF